MKEDLQEFSIDARQYEYANLEWMCGRAGEGTPCALGPSSGGKCGAICQPKKIGDRFYCENAASLSGMCDDGPQPDATCAYWPARCTPVKKGRGYACGLGACPDGPRPDGTCCQPIPLCNPVRRVLGRRKVLTLCVFAMAIGIGLLLVVGPGWKARVSPGNVTSHHGAIAEQCSACHVVGEGTVNDDTFIGSLKVALIDGHNAASDSRCLDCHRDLQNHLRQPHTTDPTMLAELTTRAWEHNTVGNTFISNLAGMSDEGGIACARCHQEHRGSDHDLKAMSDQQCQICHVRTFAGFSAGHPEFSQYPYARRSRVVFDHVSHYGLHFRDAGRLPAGEAAARFAVQQIDVQRTCAQCHQVDEAGQEMLIRDFDETCAACHESQITGDLSPGLLVLAFPVLDKRDLDDDAQAAWPYQHADHPGAGGTLSPILRLLLLADPTFETIDPVVRDLDLSNQQRANLTDEQREAVKLLPNILETAAAEMLDQGQASIEERLARVLGEEVSPDQIRQMAELIPAVEVAFVLQQWKKGDNGRADMPLSRRLYGHRDLSFRYRPTRHADPTLRAWIDASVRLGHDADENNPMGQIYQSLSQVASPGRCLKCHSIDVRGDSTAAVNWHPFQGPTDGSFTTFFHEPHIVMLGDYACRKCHVLHDTSERTDTWSIFRQEYFDSSGQARHASVEPESNFKPMQKAACATCHTPERAIHNCTTCHSYHVEAPVLPHSLP